MEKMKIPVSFPCNVQYKGSPRTSDTKERDNAGDASKIACQIVRFHVLSVVNTKNTRTTCLVQPSIKILAGDLTILRLNGLRFAFT
jgi:hypothetical protein